MISEKLTISLFCIPQVLIILRSVPKGKPVSDYAGFFITKSQGDGKEALVGDLCKLTTFPLHSDPLEHISVNNVSVGRRTTAKLSSTDFQRKVSLQLAIIDIKL